VRSLPTQQFRDGDILSRGQSSCAFRFAKHLPSHVSLRLSCKRDKEYARVAGTIGGQIIGLVDRDLRHMTTTSRRDVTRFIIRATNLSKILHRRRPMRCAPYIVVVWLTCRTQASTQCLHRELLASMPYESYYTIQNIGFSASNVHDNCARLRKSIVM
jgi:hypothetical protein